MCFDLTPIGIDMEEGIIFIEPIGGPVDGEVETGLWIGPGAGYRPPFWKKCTTVNHYQSITYTTSAKFCFTHLSRMSGIASTSAAGALYVLHSAQIAHLMRLVVSFSLVSDVVSTIPVYISSSRFVPTVKPLIEPLSVP